MTITVAQGSSDLNGVSSISFLGFSLRLLRYIMMVILGAIRASRRYLGRSTDTDSPPPRSSSSAEEGQFDEDSAPYDQKGTALSDTSSAQSQEDVKQKAESGRERDHVARDREIRDLKNKLEAVGAKNERLRRELEQRYRRNQDLGEKLSGREREIETLKRDWETLTRGYDKEFKQLSDEANRELTLRDSEITTLAQTKADLAYHYEKLAQEQALHIQKLQQDIGRQKLNITELTETISHSSQTATTSRDDDYFSGEFARLTGAIRQCVLRYFDPRDAPAFRLQDLPETITKSLEKIDRRYSTAPDSKIKISRKEIEAVIAQRLTASIFRPNFVFKLYGWPSIPAKGFPAVSDREKQKWRAQTSDMLTKHKDFDTHFTRAVQYVTEDLQNCFSGHVKPGMIGSRNKVLRSIVEQAAKLAIEISRELSPFELLQILPGTKYLPAYLDDRSGTVDNNDDEDEEDEEEEEEEEKKMRQDNEAGGVQKRTEFIVDTVLFPPVWRWDFDEAGKFVEPEIIVRKGVVTAILRETDHQDWTG